jgi:hypothetical protein
MQWIPLRLVSGRHSRQWKELRCLYVLREDYLIDLTKETKVGDGEGDEAGSATCSKFASGHEYPGGYLLLALMSRNVSDR